MRRVAQRLGVNPTSLYNHVPDRAAMIEDVRALVSARIDSAPLREMPWEEGLVAWARSYRRAFARHHRAVPLLMTTRASAPVLLAEYEDFVVAAERVGWPSEEVLPLLTAFESFILGSVLDMSGPTVVYDPVGQEDRFPRFSAAYSAVQQRQSDDPIATRAFERGLAMLVASARPEGRERPSTTPLPDAAELARAVVDAHAGGRWAEITAQFDDTMRAGLTEEGLAEGWAYLAGLAGAYERHGDTAVVRAGDFTVTTTPMVFEAGDFVARITFRDDHTIAGLYILNHDPKTSE